ncbi:hypothetical protein M011DRAFT_404551 [Sporormia fimetaria CBS 119925]|uniref:Apple domain-containing protein n=1 Tax=Sporormia fimetaria CBS 119925 TaxID=1340428 RepID=A0A6A6V9C7_9PLEO|nr:hypothetical protein M011DRAFT_404551 [Sporormia fimetaria CBS 119925]
MFFPTSTVVLTILAAVTTAAPTPSTLSQRAGEPVPKPIPNTCTTDYPFPPLGTTQGYIPTVSAKEALFYSSYYDLPSPNKTESAEFCLQQCYGYGYSTECKCAFWAENVEVPKDYYGGGPPRTACLFFNRTLEAADFEKATTGQATTPFAANIHC